MKRIMMVLVLVLLLGGIALGQQTKRTKMGWLICVAAEDVLYARQLAGQGDKKAFYKMVLESGKCNILKPGLEVYVMESRSREGLVKIRMKGEVETAWTDSAALE